MLQSILFHNLYHNSYFSHQHNYTIMLSMMSQSSPSSKIISMINIIEDVFVVVTMIVISVLQLLMNFNNVSCESNKAITLKQSIREEPSTTNNNIEQRSNFLLIEHPKILMIEYSTYPDNDEGTCASHYLKSKKSAEFKHRKMF